MQWQKDLYLKENNAYLPFCRTGMVTRTVLFLRARQCACVCPYVRRCDRLSVITGVCVCPATACPQTGTTNSDHDRPGQLVFSSEEKLQVASESPTQKRHLSAKTKRVTISCKSQQLSAWTWYPGIVPSHHPAVEKLLASFRWFESKHCPTGSQAVLPAQASTHAHTQPPEKHHMKTLLTQVWAPVYIGGFVMLNSFYCVRWIKAQSSQGLDWI